MTKDEALKMGLMCGKAIGYKFVRYFAYICIGKHRVPIFRWRVKK